MRMDKCVMRDISLLSKSRSKDDAGKVFLYMLWQS